MKLYHILPTVALGLGVALGFTSCADDNDSNPVLHMPDTFTLNTPAPAGNTYDLKNTTDSITFTWSQPNYGGMPLATTYKLQYVVAKTGNEVVTTADGKQQFAEGVEVKEYDESKTKCEYKLAPADVDLILLRETGAKADNMPASTDVYYRVSAQTTSTQPVYSNIIKMTYAPYYQRTEIAEPVTWYLVGSCFADGTWGNQVPTSTLPLYLTGDKYDEDSGYGTISWTGYIPADAIFKLRGSLTDNWATQIGQGAEFGQFAINDGGCANIAPGAAGVYTITVYTKAIATGDASGISITKTDDATTYNKVYLNGSFNNWGDGVAMSPVNTTVGENNHDWYTRIHLPAGTELKFQANNWKMEIGSKYKTETPSCQSGYYGVGAKSGGENIYIANEADYLVIVNDITGAFRFIKE